MDNLTNLLSTSWPIILVVSGIIGGVFAWFATKALRKNVADAQVQMGKAQDEMIIVFKQTIEAKKELARATAETVKKQLDDNSVERVALLAMHATQITRMSTERQESDARHESIIAEYRASVTGIRAELLECANKRAESLAELGNLRARTDFQPVMEFLQQEAKTTREVQQETLKMLAVIAPVMERVMEALRMPSDSVRKVEVMNDLHHRIPVAPPNEPLPNQAA